MQAFLLKLLLGSVLAPAWLTETHSAEVRGQRADVDVHAGT